MGFFDSAKADQIKFLEEERSKLWQRLTKIEGDTNDLRKQLNSRASDSDREAKEHSRKASEYRNKIELKLQDANELFLEINNQFTSSVKVLANIQLHEAEISKLKLDAENINNRLFEIEKDNIQKVELLNVRISEIDLIFKKYPNIEDEILEIEGFLSAIDENKEKSEQTLNEIQKKKKEIDLIHRQIFGFSQKDIESGIDIKTEGLKDELEKSFAILSSEVEDGIEKVKAINQEYEVSYSNFEKEHKGKYEAIQTEIRSLLPNALTAGLSAAFSKKKEDEESSSIALQKKFNLGIYFLIGVSFIPLAISIYFLTKGITLNEVLFRIPRLVLAIVPMYIPVLWFAISASKKLNLSKRLIEEYAHKEVLSRTYEGLSNQISNIDDKAQSAELKFRLLTNFLQVTSENPGKLISNYEASDHPVMEALEQSYKFQVAIDKLDSIPGLGKVAAILEKKTKRKLEDKANKIEKGLDPE